MKKNLKIAFKKNINQKSILKRLKMVNNLFDDFLVKIKKFDKNKK